MDPWQRFESTDEYCNINGSSEVDYIEDKLEFEDNFEPPKIDRLPDSAEYLALLGEFLLLFYLFIFV